ncbi:MAG TPA: guanylate kinase [Mariniphaga anaerophila]|uniref:Guanylate kinase n=1 Tax=Mariniphaga anaerophila TaxID=1484053 RepID=A0A831PJY5_9BACT|nr:guanylate kinase [Mariniphaga anaerophila]
MNNLDKIKNENIAESIYFIRGEKVMLDIDLASLYNVETRVLKQAVRRNSDRFPNDFMFQLNEKEIDMVVSQNVIPSKSYFGGAKPFAFTEQGVAMLSGVLKSKRAIKVNIAIMRTFVQMRKLMVGYKELENKIEALEKKYDDNFSIVFKALKSLIVTKKNRPRPIGYKNYNENKSTSAGRLIIFSAPSGAGKTTIVKHLLQQDLNLEFSVSATNREPRQGEVNGKDYYFLTEEEFRKKIETDEFLEWEEVYNGIFYGTLKSEVERIRNAGKNVIFDVDVVGGLNIKKFYGTEALAVFVQPPSVEELKNRLKNRSTESEEKIKMRIAKAEKELEFARKFDVIIVNDKLPKALNEAEKVVSGFLSKKDENNII